MLERAPADRPIHLAISGGSTPGPIFRRLARQGHPDPARVRLYFADERAVPRDDPASNYRLARETLIDPVGIPDEHVFPMIPESWGEPTPEALQRAATAYEAVLPPRLDLILLGLGQDGHTASLFPGTGIEWPGATVPARVVPARAPSPPHERLTLTATEIWRTRLVVMLVSGPSKARAVEAALQRGTVDAVPGRIAAGGVWIIGADAAPETTSRAKADASS